MQRTDWLNLWTPLNALILVVICPYTTVGVGVMRAINKYAEECRIIAYYPNIFFGTQAPP